MAEIIPFDLNITRASSVQVFIKQAFLSANYIDQKHNIRLYVEQVGSHSLTIEQIKSFSVEL